MRSYLLIFVIVSSTLTSNGQGCSIKSANSFLHDLFRNGNYFSYDSTEFLGYDKNIKFLNTPLLNKLLPDYCFYATTFRSTYYEYHNVETALAISENSQKNSLLIHSPVFTNESEEFINLFCGLQVSDTTQEKLLATEIMSIFSNITYRGEFNKLVNLKEKDAISFELWHDDLSWRIYDFVFDSNNKLEKIKILPGVMRGAIWTDYKRE